MSKPTCRELLDDAQEAIRRVVYGRAPMRIPADPTDPDLVLYELAARVERVLALCKSPRCIDAYDLARQVERLLNGEDS